MTSKAKEYETSLYAFVLDAWPVLNPGTVYGPSSNIRPLCEHLEAIASGKLNKVLINMDVTEEVQQIVAVYFMVWGLLRNPEEKSIVASSSRVVSVRHNMWARELIDSFWYMSPYCSNEFRLVDYYFTKGSFGTDKGGYILTTSTLSAVPCARASQLVLINPQTKGGCKTEIDRLNMIDWFDNVWVPRLRGDKTDTLIVVAPKLHNQDLSNHILNDLAGWAHINL